MFSILEAALLRLGEESCFDAPSGHTVLHRLIVFRARRALSAAHAVRIAEAVIGRKPSLLTHRDVHGNDPAALAMSAPHCNKLAELFCECVATKFFERFVPITPFSTGHLPLISLVLSCRYHFAEPLHPILATSNNIQYAGIDRTTKEEIMLSLYRRRDGWENEIHQRERTVAAALADVVLPVMTCTALAETLRDHAEIHPEAQTSKQLRLAFVSQIAATTALSDLKEVGAQVSKAGEQGRLVESDLHELRTLYAHVCTLYCMYLAVVE